MNIDTLDRLNRAIQFATTAHEGQYRKNTTMPYITHPFMVGTLLAEAGCAPKLIMAGYLHDILEDTAVTENEILENFGEEVLELVKGSSEPNRALSWEERKKHTIKFLLSTATEEICMVACADKLHNVRSIVLDYVIHHDAIWSRFNRGKEQQAWYYTSLVDVLTKRIPDFPLLTLLEVEVNKLFKKST